MEGFSWELQRWLGVASVVLLPGAWFSFLVPLRSAPWLTRLALGVVISPFVLAGEMLVLLGLGIEFERAVGLVALLNLPALGLMAWRRGPRPLGERPGLGPWLLVVSVPLAYLFYPMVTEPDWRLFWEHGWMQADVVSQFARGVTLPEEPWLAGEALAYPWVGHLHQAVVSEVLESPSVSCYVVVNVLWLLAILHFVGALVRDLGGGALAHLASIAGLAFAINIVGYSVSQVLPSDFVESHQYWGDWRYTPWLWKLRLFNQMPQALGLVAALAWLLGRDDPELARGRGRIYLGVLVTALGVLYPLLLPPVAALVMGYWIAPWWFRSREGGEGSATCPRVRTLTALVAALGAGLAAVHLAWLSKDKTGGAGVFLSSRGEMFREGVRTLFVMLPLCMAALFTWRRARLSHPRAPVILTFATLLSGVLYVVLSIPHWRNEYKFVFAMGIFLAPAFGLWLEPWLVRRGRGGVPILCLLVAAMGWPMGHKFFHPTVLRPKDLPPVVTQGTHLQLEASHPWSETCRVLLRETPADTLLVADAPPPIHLATFCERSWWVIPARDVPYFGVNLTADHILRNVRGYAPALIDDRRETSRSLLDAASTPKVRARALEAIHALGRPAAILLDEARHGQAAEWLEARGAKLLLRGNGRALWLSRPIQG